MGYKEQNSPGNIVHVNTKRKTLRWKLLWEMKVGIDIILKRWWMENIHQAMSLQLQHSLK